VLLLPHASASEIDILTVIAEHCIRTALTSHAAPEQHAEDLSSQPVDAVFLEVDAMDYVRKWYKAVVIEGSLDGDDDVKVHFVGCTLQNPHDASACPSISLNSDAQTRTHINSPHHALHREFQI
jgi:hypothetical protein